MDSTLQIIIAAKDMATASLTKVQEQLDLLAATATEAAAKADASMGTLDASMESVGVTSTAALGKTRTEMDETIAKTEEMQLSTSMRLAMMNASYEENASKMKGMAGTAAIVGVAVAGYIGVKAVQSAADFQTQLTKLATTAGESTDKLGMVGTGIQQISVSTGTGVKELADAMYTVESAGFHGQKGLDVLKSAAQGARLENADLTKVTDAVTTAMTDYAGHIGPASDVTSKMVAAVGHGKTTFEEFTGSLHSVLPLASALNVPFNDIIGSLSAMTLHGISAQQASENMADALRHLQLPTGPMIQEFAQLGLTSNQVSDSLSTKGLSGTMELLSSTILDRMGPSGKVLLNIMNTSKDAANDANKMISAMPASLQTLAKSYQSGSMSLADYRTALKGLPTDQAQLMQQFASLENRANGFSQAMKIGLPGTQTYSAALQRATGDASSLSVALMISGANAGNAKAAIEAVGGASAKAGDNVKNWSEIQDNMNFKMSQAKEAVNNTQLAIGTALLPAVTAVLKAIDNIIVPLATWAENHRQLATTITLVVGALAGAIGGMMLYDALVNKVKASETVMAVSRKALAAATWIWNGAQDALTASTIAFDTVLDAMGIGEILMLIGLIIAAIIALILGIKELITHWKSVEKAGKEAADKIKEVWQPISAFFGRLWDDITRIFKDGVWFIGQLWDDPLKAIQLFGQKVNALFDRMVGDFKFYGKKFLEAIISGFEDSATDAEKLGKDLLHDIRKGWDDAVKDTKSWFSGAWEQAKKDAKQWGKDIVKGIKEGIKDLINYDINSVLNWTASAAKAVTSAISFGKGIIKSIKSGWDTSVKDVKQWGKDVVSGVSKGVSDSLKDLPGTGKKVITEIIKGFKDGVTDVVNFFKNLPKDIEKDLHDSGTHMAENHTKGVSDHWKDTSKMKKLGEDILKGILIAIAAVIGGIILLGVSIAIALINAIITGIKDSARAIGDGIGWVITEIGKHWGGVKDVVEAPFKAAFNGISHLWNDSVGKLSFKAPSWVPGMGGKGFDMPKLPYLASGTPYFGGGQVVVGESGPEVVNLPQGSQVYSNANSQGMNNQPLIGSLNITIQSQAYMGNQTQAQQFAGQIYQQLQQIARRHGQAAALPNIGILPN